MSMLLLGFNLRIDPEFKPHSFPGEAYNGITPAMPHIDVMVGNEEDAMKAVHAYFATIPKGD